MRNGKKGGYLFLRDTKELADQIDRQFKSWVSHKYSQEMRRVFKRAYESYYGMNFGVFAQTGYTGEEDEYSTININHARSLIKNIMALTLQNKLTFDCIAENTDVQARNNAVIGESLLDQYFYEQRFENTMRYSFELGLMSGTSFVFCGWKTGVDLAGVDENGQPVYKGQPDVWPISLLDCFAEPFKDQWDDQNWFVFRRIENRYDLMNKYPDLADDIEKVPEAKEANGEMFPCMTGDGSAIWIYYSFHKPTPALPQGRFMMSCEGGFVISDDVNPYECIPVVCYRPEVRFGSMFGHTPFFDLMPIQEHLNILDSASLTLAENFAVPNIIASDTFNANETDISGGLKLITGKPDPDAPNGGFPQAMQMPEPNAAYKEQRMNLVQDMEMISGVNATVRGQASANASGTAIALVTSAAQQYNSTVEAGYIQMVEDFSMQLLRVCRMFMRTEDVVAIAGKYKEFMVQTFEGSDLDAIKRVKISLGNPFAKTQAGRVEIATQLLNQQQIDGAQFMNIVSTGQLESYLEPKVAEDSYLRLENEQMMRGQQPVLSPLDNHIKHMQNHHTLLALPTVRSNSAVLALVLEHIQEHLATMTELSVTNPAMLDIALGNPPRLAAPGPESMLMGDASGQPQQQEQAALPAPAEQAASPAEGPEAELQAKAEQGMAKADAALEKAQASQAPSDVPS